MFEAAVHKFVKSVGEESLLPVPSLDEADRCHPLSVVIRCPRRWFWQSPKYEVTPFKLHQLLTDCSELLPEHATTTRSLTTYNKTYSYDLDGKLGGKLRALLGAEISASDTVQVEAKLGKMVKVEVDQPKLMNQVKQCKMDMNHQLVKRVHESGKRIFCVIVGTAQLEDEGQIHMHKEIKAGGTVDVDLQKVPVAGNDEKADVSFDDTSDKSLTLPPGTPVAYNICQLFVSADGGMELIIDPEGTGGFGSHAETDEVDSREDLSLAAQFQGILDLPDNSRESLRTAILQICGIPASVEALNTVFKRALDYAVIGGEATSSHTLTVNNSNTDSAKTLLNIAGMTVSDEGIVTFPGELSHVACSMAALLAALMELGDEETKAITTVSGKVGPLLLLLADTLEGEPIPATDPQMSALLVSDSPCHAFVTSLGFHVHEGDIVTALGSRQAELEGAYRAVYAIWWNDDEPEMAEHAGRCNIL